MLSFEEKELKVRTLIDPQKLLNKNTLAYYISRQSSGYFVVVTPGGIFTTLHFLSN
jgi:hypothetical protein